MCSVRSGLMPHLLSAAVLFVAAVPAFAADSASPKTSGKTTAELRAAGRSLPLVFEENAGQLPAGSAFAGRTRNYSVQVAPSGLRFGLTGKQGTRTVSVAFDGSKGAKPEGMTDAGFRTNIYVGNDPQQWHTGIRNYDRVALRHLYPGIDAEFYSRGQEIEHDFFVAPGADASQLAMRVAGAKSTSISKDGDLLLTAEEGALRLHKPQAYQVMADGSHKAVDAEFTLAQAPAITSKESSYALGFKLGAYDHSCTLVIDPVITYATYIAGASGATPVAMTLDTDGDVYLTGSTSSDITTFRGVTNTPAPVTGFTPSSPIAHTLTFVAQLLSAANGSRLNWVTYYGSNSNDVVPTAIALQPGTSGSTAGAKLYFAGNTLANNLPGVSTATPTSSQSAIIGSQAGYIAALNLADGTAATLPFTTYVDGSTAASQKTSLSALTVDSVGNVTAAGASVGTNYKTTVASQAGPFCSVTGLGATGYPRGLLATVSGDLTTRVYSSYVCGSQAGVSTDFYNLTGVAVVAGASAAVAPSAYYVAGSTSLDFPKSGIYDPTGLVASSFYPKTGTGSTAFAAELVPATTTLPFSFWSAGTGKDVANGLVLDSSSNLYVFGNTTSTDLAANASTGTPATVPGLSQTYSAPIGAGTAGFVAAISNSGTVTGLTYLSGPLADTAKVNSVNAAAVDGANNIYLTGNTDEPEASFPLNAPATVASLPYSTTDPTLSQDASTPANGVKRAFLLSMPVALNAVNYRVYLAPQTGTSSGVSVAYGNATNPAGSGTTSNPFAFVLSSEQSTAPSYTTSSAADQQPPATASQASYLAQVAYAPLVSSTTPVMSVTTKSASPAQVAYSSSYSAAQSTLTATWTLQAVSGADAPSRVVFNLPQSQYLATYTSGMLTASGTAADCTLGPNVTPAPAKIAGFTCVVAGLTADSGSVTFTLVAPVSSAVNSSGGSFNIPAAAFDAQGDALNLTTNSVSVVGVPTFTLTNSVSPTTVNAARNSTDYGTGKTANTQVTYSYTVTNTNNTASTGVVLTTNLNTTNSSAANFLTVAGTPVVQINGTAAGCDPTSASGCAIPAGGTLTYSITGVYLGSQFAANQNGQFAVTTAGPQVTFSIVGNTVTVASTSVASGAVTVQVNGISVIQLDAVTTSGYTYSNKSLPNPSTLNSFQLGDTVTLTEKVENQGPNQAPSYALTITLPKGFVPGTPPSGCAYTAATSAAAGKLACTVTNIPGNGSSSINVTGTYKDTGSVSTGQDADAVAAPAYSTTPSTATVQASATTGSSDTFVTGAASQQLANNVIVANGDSTHTTLYASRVNTLSYGVNVTTPLGTTTINEKSPLDGQTLSSVNPPLNDVLTYNVSVSNSGKSVARGLYFVIPLPALLSKIDGTTSTLSVANLTFSPQLSCNYSATSAAVTPAGPAVTCYETDLYGATPPTPITVATAPANSPQAYAVSFTTQYTEASIGLTDAPTRTVSQTANNFFAAADTFNTATGAPGGVALNGTAPTTGNAVTFTLQRATAIIKTLAFAANKTNPVLTNFIDTTHINLAEATAGPGNNDTIVVRQQTWNAGPNDAAGVSISLNLPRYMVVGVPTGCTLTPAGGAAITGPVLLTAGTALTGANGAVLSCNTPSATTSAGTATGQLAPSTTSCAANGDPASATMIAYDNKCFAIAFYAKFIDSGSDNTYVGANPIAVVTYGASASVGNNVDPNVVTNSTFSATPAVQSVQRAAHVRLASAVLAPAYTNSTATTPNLLTKDSVTNLPQIAQAATRTAGGTVYNCLRYSVPVINDGPNYANHSIINYGHSAGVFVPTQLSRGTPLTSPSPVNCPVTASISQTDIGPVAPGTGAGTTVYVDGYFDQGSLTNVNSASATFQTGKFTGTGYNESNTSFAETGNTLVPDYASSVPLTIVNTPFNDSNTLGFTIQPVNAAAPTAPKVTLVFNSVSAAGITATLTSATTACSSSSAVYNTCYPYGTSPVPKDTVPVRNLYQPGAHPLYYQVPTTATVPVAATNTTSICIKAATTFPDIFVKPERTLLWVLTNGSGSTSYNKFPAGFPAFSSSGSLVGDVTVSVVPYGTASYLQVPTTVTFAQVPQAQPGTVCGAVNGFTRTNTADTTSANSAQTFGLLEPVNFAPVVVAGAIPQSNTVSKGSTSALSDIYLNRSVVSGGTLTVANTYDYDDRDPCYIASNTTTPRQTCDDNPYLYAVVFTGGHGNVAMTNPARVTGLPVETATQAPSNSYSLLNSINLSVSNAVYVAVADQAVGADAFNTDIASAVGYSGNPAFTANNGNPFYQQGDFLLQNYSPSSTTAAPVICDPGSGYLDYAVSAATVCKTTTGVDKGVFTGTGSGARYIRGGAKDPAVAVDYNQASGINGHFYDLSNVGAVGVTVSGLTGSGLIALQQIGDPAIATANITAGQTAGFYWPWLYNVTTAGVQYDLACYATDAGGNAISLAAGVSCNISTVNPSSATTPSTVYTRGVSVDSSSTAPTIFVVTANGTLYAGSKVPAWKKGVELAGLAMLLPVFFFRKRLRKGATLALVMVGLVTAPMLVGCGAGTSSIGGTGTGGGTVTPAGTYYFRVTATQRGGTTKITSDPFRVIVQKGA